MQLVSTYGAQLLTVHHSGTRARYLTGPGAARDRGDIFVKRFSGKVTQQGPVCQHCGAPVFRALLVDGDRAARVWISADFDRYGIGRVAVYRSVDLRWHARVLEGADTPRSHERRHRPHVEECTGGPVRGRATLPSGPGATGQAGRSTRAGRRPLTDRPASRV